MTLGDKLAASAAIASGDDARTERVLKELIAKQWLTAADGLIKAIPLCAGMSAEEALRRMAMMFRENAEASK